MRAPLVAGAMLLAVHVSIASGVVAPLQKADGRGCLFVLAPVM